MINPKPRTWTALQSLKTVSVQLKVQLYWQQPIWLNKEIEGTMIEFIIFFIKPLHRSQRVHNMTLAFVTTTCSSLMYFIRIQ